jgi:hypothetical protein
LVTALRFLPSSHMKCGIAPSPILALFASGGRENPTCGQIPLPTQSVNTKSELRSQELDSITHQWFQVLFTVHYQR